MRNIYDQYEQNENRLTHALACTLAEDRGLIRPFLRWLGIRGIPPARKLQIAEQQIPGEPEITDDDGTSGLPDLCIFTDEGWILVIECKVQAGLATDQLLRHVKTVKRYGFEDPHVAVLTVNHVRPQTIAFAHCRQWTEVYSWFSQQSSTSPWASTLLEYMEVYESKMINRGDGPRGAITMFNGLRFDEDHPYTYREAKRQIRLLGDELQNSRDLHKLGVDPRGKRRSAITGSKGDVVWDFLPLKAAKNATMFTQYPHLTMGISRRYASAALTIPNGVKGGFRSKLRDLGPEGFIDLLNSIEKNLRKLIRKSKGSQPLVYITQRHYRSQRSAAIVDGTLR